MIDFDPRDPNQTNKKDRSLFWMLLPVAVIFLLIMGTNLWHLAHQDFVGFATRHKAVPEKSK
ncbi:MAG: hypothetical protein ACYCXP_04435 [Leptospirillum sp.]|nr:hypothetical protein [Nitrospiraceae bacterium]